MIRKLATILNKLLPKYNHVIVQGFPNVESSAVEVANYIVNNYDYPVYFAVSSNSKDFPEEGILHSKVTVVDQSKLNFRWKYLTARYLFFTHGSVLDSFSKRQVTVNIWHGILYKKVGKLIGHEGIPSRFTVGTSKLTQEMFSKAFGIPASSVVVSGYPRNDILLRSKHDKHEIRNKISSEFNSYDKILIWMPTYRKSVVGVFRQDGIEVDNPFYIENFDVVKFNNILKKYNTLCIVKPHPMAPKFENLNDLENLMFIDDKWISDKGITLYHLVGSTDMLISDVSSIMIDYMLMNQPIICVSADFESYKNSRGFYFNDIENWIPSEIIKDQQSFFNYLNDILLTGEDPYVQKRESLKNLFFSYHDNKSTERLINNTFSKLKRD